MGDRFLGGQCEQELAGDSRVRVHDCKIGGVVEVQRKFEESQFRCLRLVPIHGSKIIAYKNWQIINPMINF